MDVLSGLKIPSSRSCTYRSILKRMDALKLPHTKSYSLLQGFRTHHTWDIYFFFSDWPCEITASCIARMHQQFQTTLDEWLSKLKGFNGFSRKRVVVRIFGFVFCEGVNTDATFDKKFKAYPIVRGWNDTSEISPWSISANVSTANIYDPALNLHTIKVVGNRTSNGVQFSPTLWDNYQHPEKCTGYQTRFWNGMDRWNATAQRHYLRVSGVSTDPCKGEFGNNKRKTNPGCCGGTDDEGENHAHIFKHEMGHCFFLDDLYDRKKYPTPLPICNCDPKLHCNIRGDDTIMHSALYITPFDHAQLRHVWNASKTQE